MSISIVEAAILARAQQVLGDKLHYEALPATVDLDAQLAARTKRLPAIFVAFLGGPAIASSGVLLDAEFGVLVITAGVGEAQRREGGTRSLGAVPILERLVPALHGHEVPDIGSLTLSSVSNLFAQALDEKGLSLYAASYRIKLPMELDEDPATGLGPLITIHGDWGQGQAADTVTLPQGDA